MMKTERERARETESERASETDRERGRQTDTASQTDRSTHTYKIAHTHHTQDAAAPGLTLGDSLTRTLEHTPLRVGQAELKPALLAFPRVLLHLHVFARQCAEPLGAALEGLLVAVVPEDAVVQHEKAPPVCRVDLPLLPDHAHTPNLPACHRAARQRPPAGVILPLPPPPRGRAAPRCAEFSSDRLEFPPAERAPGPPCPCPSPPRGSEHARKRRSPGESLRRRLPSRWTARPAAAPWARRLRCRAGGPPWRFAPTSGTLASPQRFSAGGGGGVFHARLHPRRLRLRQA